GNEILQQRIKNKKILEKGLFELNAIEDWVNPEEYVLGSGDILAINLVGNLNLYFEVLVSSEGLVDIPGHSTVDVKNMTLAEAKTLIIEKLQGFYKGTETYVNLVGIRPMKVFVLGEVCSPGACIAKPTDRLFDVLSRCGGPKRLADLNAIHLYHDSDTLIINGNEYFIKGDLTQNPHVLDGDVIFIPKAIPYEQTVTVQGGVLEPGLYPIYHDENLFQFLSQYINYSDDVQLGLVAVTRLVNNQKKTIEIDLNKSDGKKKLQKFILKPGDIIEIGILNQVYVQGEVNMPGAYPFVSGFKAVDYVGLAGGNNSDGSKRIAIITHEDGTESNGLYTNIQRRDVITVPLSTEQVYVQGEVNMPGAYPLISSFKAIDYVGLAGGNTDKGRVRTVHVIHKDGTKSKGFYTDIQRGDVIIVPRSFAAVFIGNLGVLQVISTLASVILTINVISRSK
ncbi:SLBB domain-containing protein, partial [bacterium]|nr:SLBB domain-containing protein [bacterium]